MEDKKKKHVFFVPLMFIGMGIGFLLNQYLGGSAFVASMFIGMGLGFLLDSLFVVEEKKMKLSNLKIGHVLLAILGLIFIAGGTIYLINPDIIGMIWNYLIALAFIAFGILIFIKGLEGWKIRE